MAQNFYHAFLWLSVLFLFFYYRWVCNIGQEDGSGDVVFPAKDLPQEPDFYQFQYIKAGASYSFTVTYNL